MTLYKNHKTDRRHSDATKEKIRAARRGKRHSQQTKVKISQTMTLYHNPQPKVKVTWQHPNYQLI